MSEHYTIEAGPMGPIGEGQALILRVNRNCPWNQCLFCPVYKSEKYSSRSFQEIIDDIDAIRRISDLLLETSRQTGIGPPGKNEVIAHAISNHPEIYGEYPDSAAPEQLRALQSLNNVANWLGNGAQRVFLQDANALSMKPAVLAGVLRYLKGTFPTVHTITCYARSKTCLRRSEEEFRELKEAGLSWCFVGIESGCDVVLDYMRKGVHKKEHVEGGQKLMASGISMAAFVMPGLSGRDDDLAQKHISDTVEVLNEIQPTEVRIRSLAVLEGTALHAKWESGEFLEATEDQTVEEIRRLTEGLTFDCTFETLQMTNSLLTLKAPLHQIRQTVLEAIDWYQHLPPIERADFLLGRYLHDGYLDCVKAWGKYDSRLEALIQDAETTLEGRGEEALDKAGRAIFAIKSKGVP